jgi:hypothetical protein
MQLFRPMFSVRQAKGSALHDDILGRTGNRRFPRTVFGAARNKLAARTFYRIVTSVLELIYMFSKAAI